MEDFLTPAERAETAFKRFVASLPADVRDEIEADAWGNAFSVECYREYADDLERWTVALTTAEMAADERGLIL